MRRELSLVCGLCFTEFSSYLCNTARVKGYFHSVACWFWQDVTLSDKLLYGFLSFATKMFWQTFYGVILRGMFLANNALFKQVLEHLPFNCR